MKIRIGFTLIGGGRGTGVYNYLLNLITLLCANESHRITPILFLGLDTLKDEVLDFEKLSGLEIVYTSALNRDQRSISLAKSILFGLNSKLRNIFLKNKLDVVFESAQFYGWRLKFPVIAWMPDFQHRHLKWMFSWSDYWRREIGFLTQIYAGRAIMLSSEDARSDCERFYKNIKGITRAVKFAVSSSAPPSLKKAYEIADSYGLPKNFFYMPNQFFKHKNHFLVLEAVALLRERGCNVVVVSSGKQFDPRHPHHYDSLCARISELDLRDEFRILGLIPYQDILSLMRASISLLNPSLFEGWSTSVEEARSLGTPMLLSDLPVHYEQVGDIARYFDKNCPLSLADAMQKTPILLDLQREENFRIAQLGVSSRCKKFTTDFVSLVEDCMKFNF